MILGLKDIEKSFGTEVVLKQVSFSVEEGEKIALIGVNGAGKSTLFKMITGELSVDNGSVFIPKEAKIGYFSQNLEIDSNKNIYEEFLTVFEHIISLEQRQRELELKMNALQGEELETVLKEYSSIAYEIESNNGYEYESRIKGVMKGLGFNETEFYQPVYELSGGQKTRVALGKLLLSNSDLLLLDEPTNHLDIDSIQWLEDYLKGYKGSIIIISHDRYFLDKVATRVVEIENGKSYVYSGNYTFFAKQKEIDRDIAMKHYISQQKEIKHQQEVIKKLRQFNREKSIKRAESREKALERMEIIDAPENLPDKMRLILKPEKESGNDVLSISDLAKSFDDKQLFKNLSLEIKKGEKVALVGANGIGKTTLFRIILDGIKADCGEIKLGTNVVIGYYDQEHATLDSSKTIFDEISDTYPKLTILEIRNALATFVFTGDDVFKPISALSGGEKGRVALAKIMLSNANFLILDEPTNHLDLNSKEILEKALQSYEGTILYISHDRYFINNTAQRVIEMTSVGINNYLGNYDYYMERKSAFVSDLKEINVVVTETESKTDWKKQKEEQSQQRKKENVIKKLEEEIAECEEKIQQLDEELLKPEISTNAMKATELFNEKQELDEKLLQLYEQWEEINS